MARSIIANPRPPIKPDRMPSLRSEEDRFRVGHNIYDVIGSSLYRAYERGKLDKDQLADMLKEISLQAKIDLGKGYGVNLGYNVPSGRGHQDEFRVKFTKDIF